MTITKMCIKIKQNLITIMAAVLATLVLFFDVASVAAFNGKGGPSGPPSDRRGSGYNRAAPGPRSYRGGPGPGNYRGERSSEYYRNDRSPEYYRSDRSPEYYRSDRSPEYYRSDRSQRFYRARPFSPYGGPQRGGYGERRAVQSRGDAQRMLNDYYMRRNMRIGPIRENRFYYEADILDRNNRSIDRVIIDKRSGRIRSIY